LVCTEYVTSFLDIAILAINFLPIEGKHLSTHFSNKTINQSCASFGNMTAMHIATAFRNGKLIRVLLKLGGNIWMKDDNGNSPYDLARIIHGELSQCFQIFQKVVELETCEALSMTRFSMFMSTFLNRGPKEIYKEEKEEETISRFKVALTLISSLKLFSAKQVQQSMSRFQSINVNNANANMNTELSGYKHQVLIGCAGKCECNKYCQRTFSV